MCNEDKNSVGTGWKIALVAVVLLVVFMVGGVVLLPMLQTVGGSFGYGFPSGSGGRAIRDVEIEVDPQVVYRIDDHRFFTLEKYISCTSGGFVYYNDTNKKIKVFAGLEGLDEKPQNEFTITRQNDVLSFNGKFVYAASENIIAYPGRNVNYKYGGSTYFVVYKNINDPSRNTGLEVSSDIYNITTISDDAIYIQASSNKNKYERYPIPKKSDRSEWVDVSNINFGILSQDDHFHCNNDIKPKRVKFIKS
ncbi:hypothetical protein SAMN05428971_0257 [Candidatus Pantoea varia]|uniref:Tli3-like domain-containing protein n=1 Tax=Candidatus Pantoea varia TaxID=1881036 RepID=A0A1I4WPL0_9GAMM|nr:hypothetical protein [Pantoea varia]SFN14959.1 hypothetical protein SAMN05428971_0257 [Pantoea varia]